MQHFEENVSKFLNNSFKYLCSPKYVTKIFWNTTKNTVLIFCLQNRKRLENVPRYCYLVTLKTTKQWILSTVFEHKYLNDQLRLRTA